MVHAIRYRVGQFFRALGPDVPEVELQSAIQSLSPQAQALFRRQDAQDQRHALAVYRALIRAGHTNADLLTAALLHDCGKAAAPCPPWARAVAVLLGQFAPKLLAGLSDEALGAPSGPTWRRALRTHVRHAETGARWARQVGCSERVVSLIRRHRENRDAPAALEDDLLAALIAADAVN